MVMSVRIGLVCLAAMHICAQATAADFPNFDSDSVHLNGYGTLGLAWTDVDRPLELVRDLSEPGQPGSVKTLLDTRLGLQINWRPSQTVELVGQAVLRRQSTDAGALQYVNWGFIAWQPSSEWKLRLGRTSPDMFLLADYRNVAFGYPWVRPNLDFYGFAPVQSIDGGDITRTWTHGDARWQARIGLGQNSSYSGSTRTAGAPATTSPIVDVRDTLTATLSHEEGGLLLKASYVNARTRIDTHGVLAPLQAGLRQLAESGIPGVSDEAAGLSQAVDLSDLHSRYLALGAQYEGGPWWLTAEISRVQGSHSTDGLRGYVSAGYRIGPWLPFVMFGRATPSSDAKQAPTQWAAILTPLVGAQAAAGAVQLGTAAAQASNRGRFDQHSASIGARWDISPQSDLKLQYDRIHIGAGGDAAWSGGDGFHAARADVVTVTFDFLF